ncbi:MAG: sigma-54 factor interaction domain-containing protein, partial [Haliangium ochraceum]
MSFDTHNLFPGAATRMELASTSISALLRPVRPVAPISGNVAAATVVRSLGHNFAVSRAMHEIYADIDRLASTDVTVTLTGETGTGKDVFAHLIHDTSQRASKPFVVFDCGAVPPNLVESELFGHERGAFTGALQRKLGRLDLAQGGTLFLDEVAELSGDLQVKLLRVLQEREYERVGGTQTIRADVRVIAATHRNLEAERTEG